MAAPWTNPPERLRQRWKQEVLHAHDFGDDGAVREAAVPAWREQGRNGSIA